MSETPQTIRAWALATFGEVTIRRGVSRAAEELDEALTELADVTIVLCHATRGHWLMWPAVWLLRKRINAKMAINRARRWDLRGDGTAQHRGGGS